jgi:hypothetical protein
MGNWDTFLRGPSRAVMSAMAGGTCDYWPRTWVLRAFLYARDPTAQEAVIACLSDESWRVREMAAKVVARRSIGDALASIAPWQNDDVARVRAAAQRAREALVQNEA